MDWGYAKGLGRSALGGATFEFGDELEAALRALPPGSPEYAAILKQVRAEQGRFEEQNPKAALAANLGGAILGGGAGMATRAGRALAARASARPGAYGALAGGLSGAGMGEDPTDRALSAAVGAPMGAVAGKVLPPAIAAALRRKKLMALAAGSAATAAGSEPQGYAAGGAVRAAEPTSAPVITIGG